MNRTSNTRIRGWAFLSHHAQVLLCIAADPEMRLRDIGERVGITERAVHRIVSELVEAGYVERERAGRRNRYRITADRRLPDPVARSRTIGELLAVLTDAAQPSAAARTDLD